MLLLLENHDGGAAVSPCECNCCRRSFRENLDQLRAFKVAPDEVLALNNELSDFTVVLHHVETNVLGGQKSNSPSPHLEFMTNLAKRARDKLLQLNRMIQKVLKQENSSLQRPPIRVHWVFVKSKTNSLRVDLRDIKLNMLMGLTTINRLVEITGRIRSCIKYTVVSNSRQ